MPSLDRLETNREQGHDGEQPEQARRGPGDGPVRPLTLGLDAQVDSASPLCGPTLERDLDLPALDEPVQDLLGRAGRPHPRQMAKVELASGLIDHSQKMTVAAIQIDDMKV